MKPVIIIAIAFVLLIPSSIFAQDFDNQTGEVLDDVKEKTDKNFIDPVWILAIASIVTAGITAFYFGIHLHFQHKENNRDALLERFNKFNDLDSKQGRKILVGAQFTPEGDFSGSNSDYLIFKKELGELDTTAHLIKKGYVPKDEFLELLAAIIIVTYDEVEPYIKFVRKKRETEYYGYYFEWLHGEAEKWWLKNRYGEKRPTKDGI